MGKTDISFERIDTCFYGMDSIRGYAKFTITSCPHYYLVTDSAPLSSSYSWLVPSHTFSFTSLHLSFSSFKQPCVVMWLPDKDECCASFIQSGRDPIGVERCVFHEVCCVRCCVVWGVASLIQRAWDPISEVLRRRVRWLADALSQLLAPCLLPVLLLLSVY